MVVPKLGKSPLFEAIKEGLRIAFLAAVGVVWLALMTGSIDWRVTGAAAGIAALKAVDKYFHENPNIKASGLLPW